MSRLYTVIEKAYHFYNDRYLLLLVYLRAASTFKFEHDQKKFGVALQRTIRKVNKFAELAKQHGVNIK